MGDHRKWLRLLGVILLVFLLSRLDLSRLLLLISRINAPLLIFSILLNIPQIALKAYRWRYLLKLHGISYSFFASTLSYFGSIFVGLLTPGRVGEFVKAIHVSRDCKISTSRAFSSVLVDRLFDLYALLLIGGAALLSTVQHRMSILLLLESALIFVVPLLMLLYNRTFEWISRLFHPAWLLELREYLIHLRTISIVYSVLLTATAYWIFFYQSVLITRAMDWQLSFLSISFAVAIGSLVTLLPISISGLGTREASIVAYLGMKGVPAEEALGFSLLIFLVFYIAGGLMGAVAWMIKPVPWQAIRTEQQ